MIILYFAASSFVLALFSALIGFSGLFTDVTNVAKTLFFVFLVLGSVCLIFGQKVQV